MITVSFGREKEEMLKKWAFRISIEKGVTTSVSEIIRQALDKYIENNLSPSLMADLGYDPLLDIGVRKVGRPKLEDGFPSPGNPTDPMFVCAFDVVTGKPVHWKDLDDKARKDYYGLDMWQKISLLNKKTVIGGDDEK